VRESNAGGAVDTRSPCRAARVEEGIKAAKRTDRRGKRAQPAATLTRATLARGRPSSFSFYFIISTRGGRNEETASSEVVK
jgi:hypothetical protein